MPWSIIALAVGFVAFGTMARLWPCNPGQGRFLVREMADDALYWAFSVLVYGAAADLLLKLAAAGDPVTLKTLTAGHGWAAAMPLWAQILVILTITDLAQYWLHRLLHGRTLWPFHAVHHSAREVTWTTTYRMHPVNWLIYIGSVATLTRVLGFSPAAFAAMAPLNLVIGGLVHANVNWTFGPFKYVVASPVFHRWHHSLDEAVRDKNFAPTFPVLDLVFGTFHMPPGRLPEYFGVDEADFPEDCWGQFIRPFWRKARRPAGPSPVGAGVEDRRAAA